MGKWVCTCPAFIYSRTGDPCKHVRNLPVPTKFIASHNAGKRVGRRAMSAKAQQFAIELSIRNQQSKAAFHIWCGTEHNPPNPVRRKRAPNPQAGYKRVRGPDGHFYMTRRESTPPYNLVKGRKGRIGTRVS